MARPVKKALDYFRKDVLYYDDIRIMELLDEFGPLGQTVYDVIITLVYKNGYYIEISTERLASLIIRTVGSRWIEDKSIVIRIIDFCAELGLLDKELLKMNVITSEGIQQRYSEVSARSRVAKDKYWLLGRENDDENAVNPRNSVVIAAETKINAAETEVIAAKTMQSKVNKNKKNESKVVVKEKTAEIEKIEKPAENNLNNSFYSQKIAQGDNGKQNNEQNNNDNNTYGKYVHLTNEQYSELCGKYGSDVIESYISRIDSYIEASGKRPYSSHYGTFLEWLKKDGVKPLNKPSFDLNAIIERAKYSAPVIDDSG